MPSAPHPARFGPFQLMPEGRHGRVARPVGSLLFGPGCPVPAEAVQRVRSGFVPQSATTWIGFRPPRPAAHCAGFVLRRSGLALWGYGGLRAQHLVAAGPADRSCPRSAPSLWRRSGVWLQHRVAAKPRCPRVSPAGLRYLQRAVVCSVRSDWLRLVQHLGLRQSLWVAFARRAFGGCHAPFAERSLRWSGFAGVVVRCRSPAQSPLMPRALLRMSRPLQGPARLGTVLGWAERVIAL